MRKLSIVLCLTTSLCIYGQNTNANNEISPTEQGGGTAEGPSINVWFNDYLKDKDTPKWVNHYIIALDSRIRNVEACMFFRRFIADSNTRGDTVKRLVEYLTVAGYPASKILPGEGEPINVNPYDIYKAIYFALTYTIIDGLPVGPEPIPSSPPAPKPGQSINIDQSAT